MGTAAGTFPIDDFSGGLVTKAALTKLKPTQSPKLMNCYGQYLGKLKKRLGYAKLNSSSTSAVCNGIFPFVKSSSAKYLMGMWAGALKSMDSGSSGWDGTWDDITQDTVSALSNSVASMDVFKKNGVGVLIVGTESRDLPHAWTGTGSTECIAGGAKAKYYKVWNNHVWAANCVSYDSVASTEDPWSVNQVIVENCDEAWDEQDIDNVVSDINATDNKEGEACVKISINATFTTGLAATKAIPAIDLEDYTYLTFAIRSTKATDAGDLEIVIDEDAECASPSENLDVPALTADTWTLCSVSFAGAGATRDVIISVGLNVHTDLNDAYTVEIDDVRATKLQYVKATLDKEDTKVGDSSLLVDIEANHTTGLVAIQNLTEIDLKENTYISLWAKSSFDSSGASDSGLQILLDDSEDCSSTTTRETLTIPKMAANTWTYHEIALGTPASDTNIRSIGLKVSTDNAAQTIRICGVRATHTEPDQLRRSALNEYDDWDGADSGWDNIFSSQDVGLTGMEELDGKLYIFKKLSMHRITYLGGRPLIDIKQVKSNIGTLSPRSICVGDVPEKGARMFFLGTDRQIYMYDGYNAVPISATIQSSNGESAVYMEAISCTTGVEAAMAMCHAIIVPDRFWYVLFVPIGAAATACTHAIVYDYSTGSFYCFDAQAFTRSCYGDNGDSDGGTGQPYTAAANYAYTWFTGNADVAAAITAYWDSAKLSAGKHGKPMLKLARYAEITYPTVASATFTFKYRPDFSSSYASTTEITQTAAGVVARDLSQVQNLLQVEIYDSSTNPAFEVDCIDVIGEEKVVGR